MLENFIPYSTQSINQDDEMAVIESLHSSHLTQGKYLIEFENTIAKFLQTQHAVCFNSATSALYVAFRIIKELVLEKETSLKKYGHLDALQKILYLKDRDNFHFAHNHKTISILTTPISFVATTNMMLENDITPIFGDICMDGNLKLEGLESLLRDDTVAICSVDYAGNSVDMEAFREFATKHNLLWISDSSHAFGGSFNGKKAGTLADIGIFSFHAVKSITTCEGGALVSENAFFAHIASLICSHGIVKKTLYNHDCITLGFNFRLNEIGARLGLSQLQRIESFLTKREEIARFYDKYFKDNPYFFTPKNHSSVISTRHLYPLLLDSSLTCKKEAIANELVQNHVGVQVHYKPIYNFSLYQPFNYPILRNAEDFYHAELSIPCHQNMTIGIAKKVADTILSVFEKYAKK
ncbi:hypothetical protein CQA53_06740 [Helicobacter didelphidarum]|uniref:UDP-4-amino-4, 6-dideoxy-N-acetyl-beta-L-altrosamine transaminase n=1 Tax=Helicobacter didelphidarum TaxID=2040648 RepID=A0A3D8IK59_9HELI|nr:DegT/DnrJ/EryC1/StrS family aminotransferase [Helicobacter didelphidarum]RDU65266.1 hypothetical protein CQA53_06740 [Helicobacter didelphidarum]